MNELAEQHSTEVATANDPGTIMQVISRAASDPSTDVDKLERLMAMYERLEARKAQAEFAAALSAVQTDLPEIGKRGEIKHGDKVISTYALWEDIARQTKPILQQHGLALSFRVDTTDNTVRVTGVLSHAAGHSESTQITLPSDTGGAKNAVQAVASSVSYGKRYVASALLNIVTHGEDDDGQTAGAQPVISEQRAKKIESRIKALVKSGKIQDRAKFDNWMRTQLKVTRVDDLTEDAAETVEAALAKREGE